MKMINDSEQKAIEKLEIEGTENNYLEVKIVLDLIDKLQSDIEIKDKVIDLMAECIYDNDNFYKLKCAFEKIEKGKEPEYIKNSFYKKVEEENE